MSEPLYKDPDCVQGQIQGIKALILALASFLPKDEFLEEAWRRLESERDTIVGHPVSDARLVAVDHLIKEMRVKFS